MAKIEGRPKLTLEVTLTLNEQEAGALDALFGYNCDTFLDVFYKQMGKAYLEPYEAGFRSLHSGQMGLRSLIERANKARRVMQGLD